MRTLSLRDSQEFLAPSQPSLRRLWSHRRMEKHTRIKLVAGSAVALALVVAVTATVAIAASNVLTANDRGQAVIDDAAAELGVEPSALEEALRQGLKNRVQEAVDAGTLTEEQGAELEQRIESGDTPLFGGFGRFHGPGGDGERARPGRLGGLETAASYLGLSQDELHEQLRRRRHARGHREGRREIRRRSRSGNGRHGQEGARRGGCVGSPHARARRHDRAAHRSSDDRIS